uniref:NADH-ubiquinone oxidoreductase chain 2 n=1 Tax=Medon apicalis TaxID=347397 RepID=A0A0S2M7U0_9COLE|nr:NADH deshydrogenase subunit 2 [Medon apicalis]
MFSFSLIIGSMISISSSTWMGMWMGLEINLLSIIPLMNNKNNTYSSEASMKYFITQALASTILMFSIILMSKTMMSIWTNQSMMIIFNSALLTKMGAAPFHFWFPEVMEGLSWNNCLVLLTWQKLAPMILLMYNISFSQFIYFIIIASMLISGIMGLNQISLRKIMAYSSINHIGWMIGSMFFVSSVWIYYFIIYTIISFNLIFIFKTLNIFYIKQLIMFTNNSLNNKIFFTMNLMSLGGLPPFLGFLPKWLTIQSLIENNHLFLTFLMTMLTLITLYYYLRLTYSTIMFNYNEINFLIKNNKYYFFTMISNSLSILGLITCTSLFSIL